MPCPYKVGKCFAQHFRAKQDPPKEFARKSKGASHGQEVGAVPKVDTGGTALQTPCLSPKEVPSVRSRKDVGTLPPAEGGRGLTSHLLLARAKHFWRKEVLFTSFSCEAVRSTSYEVRPPLEGKTSYEVRPPKEVGRYEVGGKHVKG